MSGTIKPLLDKEITDVPVLTEEKRHELEESHKRFDKLLAEEQKAKYKVEILFAHTRRLHGLSAGSVSIWESGTKLHGGGDTKAYWCPGKELRVNHCTGIIPDASNGFGHLVCPDCQTVWKGEQVIGEIFYKLDNRKWAEVLLRHYVHLGHNADIYCKYPLEDLRIASEAEQNKQLFGEKLTKARRRKTYIYPLKNLIQDTAAGADLLERFHAFLTA
jgi:hypothetical protein